MGVAHVCMRYAVPMRHAAVMIMARMVKTSRQGGRSVRWVSWWGSSTIDWMSSFAWGRMERGGREVEEEEEVEWPGG